MTGFERSLTKTVNEVLRSSKLLRVAEDDVVKDDAMEGLTAVVTVRLAEPQFEGQTKEVLGTSAASRIVANVVAKELKAFLTSTKRDAKQQARAVLEKVVAAARTRIAARQHKEAQRRKTALESSSLPAKLADCRSDDVDRSELFIVEGDSALGTAKLARNSEFQALLPIRGKILNVQKASVSDMLKNAECGAIIQVIGAGSGRTFDIDAARYGKVIFLADADVDGAHIRILLLTLFQRYMRPMVEEGRVFSAVPRCTGWSSPSPRRGRTSTSTPTPTASCGRRCWSWSGRTSATRRASSATRVSVRWTPTSSRRPRWTRATAPCGGSTSATWKRRSAPSTC
ncbi:hypothetical protein GCM10020000_20510 [Streptomyces olivoverticillatus]